MKQVAAIADTLSSFFLELLWTKIVTLQIFLFFVLMNKLMRLQMSSFTLEVSIKEMNTML